MEYQQKSGRPNKLSVRDRRKLFLESRRYPFFSAREVLVSAGSIQNISVCTVRRILRNSGLLGRTSAKKPMLNRRHIQKRLMCCKSYLQMDKKNFIFTDEARLELYSKRMQYVRRSLGQRFKTRYTQKTVKYGGPSIFVWGAIKGDGKKALCRCPPILNSAAYQNPSANQGLNISTRWCTVP